MEFTLDQVTSQKGRTIIVTGANAGLGYETALALAKKEAHVILACRNEQKAEKAKEKILKEVPDANLEIMLIDLADLDSVRAFAKNYLDKYDQLDLLINNAGVMMPPYTKTKDGFELQIGANHLGHFLLTGLLLDTLTKTDNARIVALSSLAHHAGEINFDDLQSKENYSPMGAYQQSKLANILYGIELQRRLEKAGHDKVISTIAHPGASDTELARHIPGWIAFLLRITIMPFITHSPKSGAMPTLQAALGKDVKGGEYFGPTGWREMKGKTGRAKINRKARNEEVAKRLWEVSEELVGLKYL